MPNPNAIDITIVLDRSGSMATIKHETIEGYNEFLRDQKELPGEATFTLVQFDDRYELHHDAEPIWAVPYLNTSTYVPRASTALLDAVGQRIVETGSRLAALPEQERPEKVLFVIITDGYENASHQFNHSDIKAMIQHQEDVYGWEFVYLGADVAAMEIAGQMGITPGKSAKWSASGAGAKRVFGTISEQTTRYRNGELGSKVDEFFTEEQRSELDS